MSLKNLSVITKIPRILKEKLKNKKITQIYRRFEKSIDIKERFIVAVSGGPDSLALAFLSKIYSIKNNLDIKFFIVDHKLRNGSTNEALNVKRILGKYKINAEILTWTGKKPNKNIQSMARNARYDLLFSKSKQLKIKYLLTGHQQGDLIENFFLRMLRGSGLKGLVSLDKKNKINDINLFRPLLDEKREDLEFLSNFVFNFYVQDPSNKNEKFQRIKIRQLIENLKINGLDKYKFVKTLRNLKSSNEVVNFYVRENFNRNTHYSKKENKLVINEIFFLQPYEIVFRCLSNAIQMIGGKYYSVRGKKTDNLIKKIQNNRLFKVTLGGCIIEKVNKTVMIYKEY